MPFLIKKDIFKNLMWYTLPDSNKQYPLTIERVKKIKALNQGGVIPEELGSVELTSSKPKEVEPEFADLVGQISLRSLDKAADKKTPTAAVNCFKNRTSFSLNKRISLMPYFSMAGRSIPIPKAKPVYLLGSILQFCKTLGCTMPQPKISTQPVFLQILQPTPPQIKQLTSISALGSVKGK